MSARILKIYLALVMVALTSWPAFAWATVLTFDDGTTQDWSRAWQSGVTGRGQAQWEVISEPDAPSAPHILRQSGVGDFPWAVVRGTRVLNGFVETKFKAVSGQIDQGAGVIWRFQDGNNYYIARANALEDNVVAYTMVDGHRSDIPPSGTAGSTYGVKAIVKPNVWNVLRVEFTGKKSSVFLNGQKLFEIEDGTFTTAGAVGLWTKTDSRIEFDDFTFEER